MKQYIKNQAGFSLVELIIAIAIIGLIMGGISELLAVSLQLNDRTNKQTVMQMEARKVLSDITNDVKYSKTAVGSTDTLVLTTVDNQKITYRRQNKKITKEVVNGSTTSTKDITDGAVEVTEFQPSSSLPIDLTITVSTDNWNKSDSKLTETVKTTVRPLPISN